MMMRRTILGLAGSAAAAAAFAPGSALSHGKSLTQEVIGTWALATWVQTRADGSKIERFGEHPKGFQAFLPDGRMFLMIARPDLPRIASKDTMKPGAAEATALSVGTLAYYGTYTVNEKDRTIDEKLEASTFPNQLDVPQIRTITAISATAMHFGNSAAVGGGRIDMDWVRVK
jgi:Lipocalin-like domain